MKSHSWAHHTLVGREVHDADHRDVGRQRYEASMVQYLLCVFLLAMIVSHSSDTGQSKRKL